MLLALSGGVDSSVALRLLKDRGYDVLALVIDFSPASAQAVEDARQAAKREGVPLWVEECHDAFQRNVIDSFAAEYYAGRTPNPCVVCNPTTKFAVLLEKARALGCRWIATGHYARVCREERAGQERFFVRKARSPKKDQSYMLYRLGQEVLGRLLMPLGEMESKEEVRLLARELCLPAAERPDSQEICFIPDGDYPSYLQSRYGPAKGGVFRDPEGRACGEHGGILRYTVGQRKGLGVALGYPAFVKSIDPVTGDIFLGRAGEEYSAGVILDRCVFPPASWLPGEGEELRAKIRSGALPADCRLSPLEDGRWQVTFREPQRAAAPGQSCVVYQGELVLGGGMIAGCF